jgi:uncharacterized protein (TIGR00730 family)
MMQQIQAPAPFADLSVCLFCGSSDAIDAKYLRSASAFGEILAHDGVRLVYGGGGIGLMGAAARAAHEAGGRVLGVIPEFLCRKEVVYDAVETLVVPNMHERKRIMFEQADAFAVFPGGIGTLEEAIELISWRRLDLHRKPIVFLNLAGFWDPLFRLIDHTVDLKVTPSWLSSTWSVAARTEDVLPIIRTMLEDQHADPPQAVTIRG